MATVILPHYLIIVASLSFHEIRIVLLNFKLVKQIVVGGVWCGLELKLCVCLSGLRIGDKTFGRARLIRFGDDNNGKVL